MVLGDWGFRAKHIPGSLNIAAPEVAKSGLGPHDEIVVYCSGDSCPASKYAYKVLTERGYKNERRYAGGQVRCSTNYRVNRRTYSLDNRRGVVDATLNRSSGKHTKSAITPRCLREKPGKQGGQHGGKTLIKSRENSRDGRHG